MFWIIGGEDLISSIADYLHRPFLSKISANLTSHVEWEGFHFYDMIFPLFLFIIGVTLPMTFGRRLAKGDSRAELVKKILQRTFVMFVFGLIYYGLLEFKGWDHQRIMGVLQRLALGYCAASFATLFLKRRSQIILFISLLVGYYLAMRWLPVPGFPLGTMSPEGNFANYLDRLLFKPGQLYEKYGDPEGLFSTIPAVATALLGVFAGQWLQSDRDAKQKAVGLALAGCACLALGNLWGLWFPIIKKIWTSSYVLVAGGWSLLLLALFYWIIDVRGWKRWAFFFAVIGVNPLTIYLAQKALDFDKIAGFYVNGILQFTPLFKPILFAISILTVKWLLLWFLYRQKLFLRV